MNFWNAKKRHRTNNPRERKVRIRTHIVQMRRESIFANQHGQLIVPRNMSGVGDVELEGRESAFMRTDSLAVERNLGATVSAFEQQLDAAAPDPYRNLQVPPV